LRSVTTGAFIKAVETSTEGGTQCTMRRLPRRPVASRALACSSAMSSRAGFAWVECGHDHRTVPGACLLDEQHRAGRVAQQFPVRVREHPTRDMAGGVAFGHDEVGTGAKAAPHDRLGDRMVPFGRGHDLDAMMPDAPRHGLEPLHHRGMALLLVLPEALTAGLERIDEDGLGERMEEFERRAGGARQLRGLAHGGHGSGRRVLDGDQDAFQRLHGEALRPDGYR
jgi:hypothetical protein